LLLCKGVVPEKKTGNNEKDIADFFHDSLSFG
jgi:hypothetical protein